MTAPSNSATEAAELHPSAPAPEGLLPHHWAELQASAIPAAVAAANVASWGPETGRHWEDERQALVRHARYEIQTASVTASGHPQTQAGHLSARLGRLDQRYRHLTHGGWRTLSADLPGHDLPGFDQWKPDRPRPNRDKPEGFLKYESPPRHPDGGGLLLPHVPERCWRLIAERQGLPLPDADTIAAGFWAWALATPGLQLLICEGWKKALAAIGAGHAAVGLPGVTMGRRVSSTGAARLIPALRALTAPGRPWLIAFDAEAKATTAAKVAAAAGALAGSLRAAGGRPLIARLPLLPGTDKTGLDDLLAAAGPEALDRALADTGPRPVLPRLRPADRSIPHGQRIAEAGPLPSPELAPLLLLRAPMGSGKTFAIGEAVQDAAVLMPSHRRALGQAAAAAVGTPWRPMPGSDQRFRGAAACLDSWCPDSPLQITEATANGAVVVIDELMQQLAHLLASFGTTLSKARGRRVRAMRTLAGQLARCLQIIAADAQLAEWAAELLEALTGRRAYVIRSDHRPMLGRHLHAPTGLKTPQAAADAFRDRLTRLIADGRPFLCWTSAQKAGSRNAPQNLAAWHRQQMPGARVLTIDSTTPEDAARLANGPDTEAERWDAIYCSPSISSGISFDTWKPAAVIAYTGGHIPPEDVAQALARVRSPEVPAYLFAPEACPGNALTLTGASSSTDPAQLIADLRAATDPVLGRLQDAGPEWLQAWAQLAAIRNRQRFAYRATIAGLLEAEGWALQAPGPAPDKAVARRVADQLQTIAEAALAAEDAAVINAPALSPAAAAELQQRPRQGLTPADRAALDRFDLIRRWGGAAPSPELLAADRDGLRDRLRLGWLLSTPEALALVPAHDRGAMAALDPQGQPFGPDRIRHSWGPKLWGLQAVGFAGLLQRFAAGEVIAANDPALGQLQDRATACRQQFKVATGHHPCRPRDDTPQGLRQARVSTLRQLLRACGWRLVPADRIKTRGDDRDVCTYTAAPEGLPEGVERQALAEAWRQELEAPAAADAGAENAPIGNPCREQKCPRPAPPPPPPRSAPPSPPPMARAGGFRAVLRALAPPRSAPAPVFACR